MFVSSWRAVGRIRQCQWDAVRCHDGRVTDKPVCNARLSAHDQTEHLERRLQGLRSIASTRVSPGFAICHGSGCDLNCRKKRLRPQSQDLSYWQKRREARVDQCRTESSPRPRGCCVHLVISGRRRGNHRALSANYYVKVHGPVRRSRTRSVQQSGMEEQHSSYVKEALDRYAGSCILIERVQS